MPDSVKLEHFRNLVSLAAADGRITAEEISSLTRIASALKIPPDRLQVMMAHAHEYMYLVPQNNHDRNKQLHDMIDLALVDGNFVVSERQLIRMVAQKLGFSLDETEQIINHYVAGKSQDEA